jgi:hypothetical protein
MPIRFLLPLVLLFTAAPSVAQNWSQWRSIGPFDHVVGQTVPDDLSRELDSMQAQGIGPDYMRSYKGKAGVSLQWSALVGVNAGARELDLGRLILQRDLHWAPETLQSSTWSSNASIYLHRTVHGKPGTKLKLKFGSDDGLMVWWNGKQVLSRDVAQVFALNIDLELVLEKGANHLLVAVSNQGGTWNLRMADADQLDVPRGVPRAIERGARWLLDNQLLDGSWSDHGGYSGGVASLGAYTLMHAGLDAEHPAVQRAMAYSSARNERYTYSLSCEIMALCKLGEKVDEKRLEQRVEELIELQTSSGLFDYPMYPGGGAPPADMSLTIFAAMALWDAMKEGLDVPRKLWLDMLKGVELCQGQASVSSSPRAGFSYRPGGAATGSMTAAGVAVIYLCEQAMGSKMRKLDRRRAANMRLAGLSWLEGNMTFDKNPNHGSHQYYWIYGLERLGSFMGLDLLGKVDWYKSGANYLLGKQSNAGQWSSNAGSFESTVFAILFLKRSNGPRSEPSKIFQRVWSQEGSLADVRLRGHGDSPLVMSISGYSDEALELYAWPNEGGLRVTRVEYLARRSGDASEPQVLAVVDRNSQTAAGGLGYPMRDRLPGNGDWELGARVTLLAPPKTEGAKSESVLLESEPLLIFIEKVLEPEALAYASHSLSNVMDAHEVRVSSQLNDGSAAARLCDGLQGTQWLCAKTDAAPKVMIELAAPTKARRLLFSHRAPRRNNAVSGLPSKLRITLNGITKRQLLLDLDPNPLRKTSLDFGKTRKIKKITIEILEASGAKLGEQALGFSEIELLP